MREKPIKNNFLFLLIGLWAVICIVLHSLSIRYGTTDFSWVIPFFVYLSFSIIFSIKTIKIKNITKKRVLLILLVFFIGLLIRLSVIKLGFIRPIRPRLFIYHANLHNYSAMFAGWGILLSIIFVIFPAKMQTMFFVNAILGSLSPLFAYGLLKEISHRKKLAIIGAALWSLVPMYLMISTSESYTASAIFFSLLTFYFLFKYFNTKNIADFIASISFLGVAIMMRPEYVYLIPIYFLTAKQYLKKIQIKNLLPLIFLFLILLSPYLMTLITEYSHLNWDESLHGVKVDNAKWYISYPTNYLKLFKNNFFPNLRYVLFSNHDLLITTRILFLIGITLMIYQKEKPVMFVLAYFCIIFLTYTAMHYESFVTGMDKYVTSLIIPIIIGASYAVYYVIKNLTKKQTLVILVLILLINISFGYPRVSNFSEKRTKTYHYQEFEKISNLQNIDTNCHAIGNGVITVFPYSFGFKKRSSSNSINDINQVLDQKPTCVYFYEGYYNTERDKEQRKTRIYNTSALESYLISRNFNKIYSSEINNKEIFIYYLE